MLIETAKDDAPHRQHSIKSLHVGYAWLSAIRVDVFEPQGASRGFWTHAEPAASALRLTHHQFQHEWRTALCFQSTKATTLRKK